MTKATFRPSKVEAFFQVARRQPEPTAATSTAQRALYNSIARLANGLDNLNKMHSSPSPTEMPAAHLKKVMSAAEKLSAKIATTRAELTDAYVSGRGEIQARINEKIKLQPDNFAMEIRQRFHSLDAGEKTKLLGELVEQNNGSAFAAIVLAPPILTGLDPEIQARYMAALHEKHAPAELAEQEALLSAYDAAWFAAQTADEAAAEFTDAAALAKITEQEAQAEAAQAAFSQAVI